MFIKTKLAFLIVLCTVVSNEGKKRELPSYIKKCKRDSPDLTACLKENMEIIRPYLEKGIPEMKIPVMQPVTLPQVAIVLNNFNLTTNNLRIYGTTNYKLMNFEIDTKTHAMKINLFYPEIRFLGDYSVSGRLLILSLNGQGKSDVNATDVATSCELHGSYKTRKGKTYIDYTNNTIDLKIGHSKVYFENLFGANKELTEATNRVINDNMEGFLDELLPYINETVGSFVFGVIRSVFNTFAIEDLFVS